MNARSPWCLALVFAAAGVGCGESSTPTPGPVDAGTDLGGIDAPAADVVAKPDVVDASAPADLGGDVVDVPADEGAPDAPPPRCARDEDCASMTDAPACDTASGRCVRCTPASDRCPAGQYCVAGMFTCAPGCRDDRGCAAADGGVGDGGAGDGGAGGGRCDTARNTCVQCLADDDCALGQRCMGNACVPGCSAMRGCPTGSACCDGACVDVTANVAACGGCGRACATANATPACVAGACAVGSCTAPFGDCDADASNGCEVDTATTVAHCGGCGRACAARANATARCEMGACTYACGAGFGDCDGDGDNGCETDTRTAVAHCGGCGRACAARANASARCEAGACAYACDAGFADCDMDPSNGCEVDTRTSAAHCGMCGRACRYANAAGVCAAGACAMGACDAGFANCNSNAADGCEISTATNPSHCGACSNECPAPRAVASCAAGVCGIESCETGYGNCDNNAANGCETDTRSALAHCGACGNACGAGRVCAAGACVAPTSCAALLAAAPGTPSGEYEIRPAGAMSPFRVYCDMTSHGGGWTLVGSVVNGVARAWNSYEAFTDATTFGAVATRTSANYKSPAWSGLGGADLMVQTDEYAFGFRALLGGRSFGGYIAASWPATCNRAWARSGADFVTNLTTDQQRTLGFALRAHDDNASCFPSTNENAAVVFHAAECCWVNGLGNTPGGQDQWRTHDLSLLRRANIRPQACTAGAYPCNANGFVASSSGECYGDDPNCKARYALIFVR